MNKAPAMAKAALSQILNGAEEDEAKKQRYDDSDDPFHFFQQHTQRFFVCKPTIPIVD
jgi:hypothetical protein